MDKLLVEMLVEHIFAKTILSAASAPLIFTLPVKRESPNTSNFFVGVVFPTPKPVAVHSPTSTPKF